MVGLFVWFLFISYEESQTDTNFFMVGLFVWFLFISYEESQTHSFLCDSLQLVSKNYCAHSPTMKLSGKDITWTGGLHGPIIWTWSINPLMLNPLKREGVKERHTCI